jgi:hypothetical protein
MASDEELFRHIGESRYPPSSSAEQTWIPADAGMTETWKSTLSRLEQHSREFSPWKFN